MDEGPYKKEDLPTDVASMLIEGVVTLIGVKTTEDEALFTTQEAGGAETETCHLEFAGKERYILDDDKVNGVVRRIHHAAYKKLGYTGKIKKEDCTVPDPLCCVCAHCAEYGGLNTDANESIYARVRFHDLISLEEYEEVEGMTEKFRVKLPSDPKKDPVPWVEHIVPPDTSFIYMVHIFKPSKYTLKSFLWANEAADHVGYGSYTKMRGKCTTKWLLICQGMANISKKALIEASDKGKSIEEQLQNFSEKPRGLMLGTILGPDQAEDFTEELIADFDRELKEKT